MSRNSLETVQLSLPPSIAQYPYLDTSEYCLLATLEINPQLYNIAILDSKWLALLTWLAKSDVVEKSTRTALDIFDPPTRVFPEELAMPSAHDLGLEAYCSI